MLQVQKFLCCWPLETGAFVIGWSGLILSIVALVIELFLLIFCAFFDPTLDFDDDKTGENNTNHANRTTMVIFQPSSRFSCSS
jgi:hypothetical protein